MTTQLQLVNFVIILLSLLYKNIKIEICRNIISGVVLYVCDNWSPTIGEENVEGIQGLSAEGQVQWGVQITQFLVMQSSPVPCNILLLTPSDYCNLRTISCFRCMEREIRELPSMVFGTRYNEGWRGKAPRKENWYWRNIRFWGFFQAASSWLAFSCCMEVSIHRFPHSVTPHWKLPSWI